MDTIREIFRGSFSRRLFLIFLVVGIGPTILLATLPGLAQYNANRRAVADMSHELRLQAERELIQFASMSALRYDEVFNSEAERVQTLAKFISEKLEEGGQATSEDTSLLIHSSGWSIRPASEAIGFLQSPAARPDDLTRSRQFIIDKHADILPAIVESNETLRASFIITIDQNVWIYPNQFWQDGKFYFPTSHDLTTRPYFGESEGVVWTGPYIDIEPVVTVAAPIRANEDFFGMAGLDLSLSCILNEILQTSVGEQGFMFLVGSEGQLVALPPAASGTLLPASFEANPESLIDRTLLEVASPRVREQLKVARFEDNLERDDAFLIQLDLLNGPAYLTVAPMPNVPWNVAIVQPESEVSGAAITLQNRMEATLNTLFQKSWLAGIGFLLVVLIGGWITVKRLINPIQRLTQGATAIASGDLSHRVSTADMDDELISLATTFNRMASSVQTMRNDIEEKRAELATALQKREQEFHTLNRIAAYTNHQGNLAHQLSQALEACLQVVAAEYLTISLVSENGEIHHTAFAGRDEAGIEKIRTNCERMFNPMVLSTVLISHGPMNLDIRRFRHDALLSECMQALEIKQVLLSPVRSKGRPIAILSLLRCQSEPMSEEELNLLQPLCQHIAVLIENAQLQQQTRDLVMIEERRRLAGDLHDSVTQSLFSVSLAAEGLRSSLEGDHPALKLLTEQIRQVQKEMRTLINELRPLDEAGEDLQASLLRHLDGLRRLHGIETKFEANGITQEVPHHIQRHLRRITQEAISNISRHARASTVHLRLRIKDTVLQLEIEDDGRGFDPGAVSEQNTSLGLLSMRERAELMHGAMIVRSAPGEGTKLTIRVPLTNGTEAA